MKKLICVFFAAVVFTGLSFAQNDEQVADSLSVGMAAPDFTLQDADGNEYTLSSYKGESPVVVYFYPKANTGGCTKQACGIRDNWSKFKEHNIKVFGVSTDPKEDIQSFIENNSLNFPLLSDADKKVSKEYGVLKDNGMDKRVTFVIDKEGKITNIIEVNDIENHADTVYEMASGLN